MWVKICGTCRERDLEESVEVGADAVGFVVEYPDPVPWNLDCETAARLIKRVPPFVSSVLVTTGAPDDVDSLAEATSPDVVQLHGDESPEMVGETIHRLDNRGIKTLKAVAIDADDDLARQRSRIETFASQGVDGIVVDAKATDRRGGGTGRTVPWQRAFDIANAVSVPIILAGGLTPTNVADAIQEVNPYGVDVITGVERERGRKDSAAMSDFVVAAKEATRQ